MILNLNAFHALRASHVLDDLKTLNRILGDLKTLNEKTKHFG